MTNIYRTTEFTKNTTLTDNMGYNAFVVEFDNEIGLENITQYNSDCPEFTRRKAAIEIRIDGEVEGYIVQDTCCGYQYFKTENGPREEEACECDGETVRFVPDIYDTDIYDTVPSMNFGEVKEAAAEGYLEEFIVNALTEFSEYPEYFLCTPGDTIGSQVTGLNMNALKEFNAETHRVLPYYQASERACLTLARQYHISEADELAELHTLAEDAGLLFEQPLSEWLLASIEENGVDTYEELDALTTLCDDGHLTKDDAKELFIRAVEAI